MTLLNWETLLKRVGVPYEIGMDSRDRFGEAIAPEKENQIIQDLTYVLILEEFDEPVTLEKPIGYDPSDFYCATANEKCKEEMKRVLWPKGTNDHLWETSQQKIHDQLAHQWK